MAKYSSVLTIRGTIDDLTFRLTPEGKIVGSKTGPTREQVLQSDKFALTRRNASEFKRAIQDATLLRRALSDALNGVRCTTLNGHMNGLLHSIATTDPIQDYGDRCAAAGNLSLLNGFEFNKQLSLDTALGVQAEHSLRADSRMAKVQIPRFVAYKRKSYPAGATHFRFVHALVALNFTSNIYSRCIQYSELLPLSRKTPDAISFEAAVPGKAGDLLIQVLGIELFRFFNGKSVLVKGGALKIVEAAKVSKQPIIREKEVATSCQLPFIDLRQPPIVCSVDLAIQLFTHADEQRLSPMLVRLKGERTG
ncbi:hypothetical protein [Paraflavitalea sp. CAU 1676]|uniref:hypothetical protein n=1 Tax=Paraflavitalea sp. CAU 1676 TaxID=3032598 RepID=UPI0023D9D610|nr:hypothetical protein [Paraflavitalea sp. CAU 1676]MDF2191191.1 hypothetical protein [Paraflavitalea sp. CAU 1676]